MPTWLTDPGVVAAAIAAIFGLIGGLLGAGVSLYNSRQATKAQAQQQKDELAEQAQDRLQALDLHTEAKAQELEVFARGLLAEQRAVQQVQLTEVLKKRIETYPALYEITAIYGRNWKLKGKNYDARWCKTFLTALIDNNAKNGAFFSDRVYLWYGLLRKFLEYLFSALSSGREATNEELDLLFDVIRGPLIPVAEIEKIVRMVRDLSEKEGDGIVNPYQVALTVMRPRVSNSTMRSKVNNQAYHQAAGLGTYIKDELGSYIIAIVSATYKYSKIYEQQSPYDPSVEAETIRALAEVKINERIQAFYKKAL